MLFTPRKHMNNEIHKNISKSSPANKVGSILFQLNLLALKVTSARQPCPVATNLHWSWLFIKFPTYRFLGRFIVWLKRSNADFSKAHQSIYLDNNFRVQLFLQVVLIFKLYWRGTRFPPLYVFMTETWHVRDKIFEWRVIEIMYTDKIYMKHTHIRLNS